MKNVEDYDQLLNIPTHIVVIFTKNGLFHRTNVGHQRILGWDPDTVLGQPIHKFIHESDQEKAQEHLSRLFSGEEKSIGLKMRCLSKDGGFKWISWTAIYKDDFVYAIGTDATLSFEIESALAEQKILSQNYQKKFETFFEQSIFPMQIFNREGFSVAANKAWEDLFATKRTELAHYNLFKDPQVIHSPLLHCFERAFKGESLEIKPYFYDPALNDRKGRTRWLETWLSPIKDEDGVVLKVAIIHKDVTEKVSIEMALVKSVTERKAAEEKLKLTSDRLSLAVKAANIGIWEWIPSTDQAYWDETTEKIHGYMKGSFPQTTEAYTDIIHFDDRDNFWTVMGSALRDKKTYRIEYRVMMPDGGNRWVQNSGMGIYDEKGSVIQVIGTMMDISERIESENEQKFLSRISEVLSSTLDDKDIVKIFCDEVTQNFCDGVVIEYMQNENDSRHLIIHHQDSAIKTELMKKRESFVSYLNQRTSQESEKNDHPVYFENPDFISRTKKEIKDFSDDTSKDSIKSFIKFPLKSQNNILGQLIFFTNVKSSKQLKQRNCWIVEELSFRLFMSLQNAFTHQKAREAIRARDEFLSVASHELKTPLQSLTLQNQMRKRNLVKGIFEAFSPSKIECMVDSDLKHLLRFNRLIDDMLDISRIRAGKLTFVKQRIDFSSFIEDVLERFRPQLEAAGCYLSHSLTITSWVEIDTYRIEQVIVNLLTNAMKYGAGKPINVILSKKAGFIQVEVHDQGPGLKIEDTIRIFERFERAIPSTEVSGLGLGLYISRQIIEQCQGRLYVESTQGKGSIFIMEIPFEDKFVGTKI
jgi:PAS domain S-box-containing protein